MPTRPFSIARISDFGGLSDALAIQAGESQGSTVTNFLKKNRSLVRRPGYTFVAEAVPSAPMDPLDLFDIPGLTLGPILYLIGDEAVGADGALCATWTDISGFGRDAAQATAGLKPVIRDASSPNGLRRMVEFDGNSMVMGGSFPFGPGIDITNGVTLYVYLDEDSLTTGGFNAQEVLLVGNSVSAFELYTRTSAALGVGYADQEYGSGSGNVRDNYGATVLGPQVLTLVFYPPASATANIKLWKNSVQMGVTQQNWQATDIRTGYSVGDDGSANQTFDGKIGAVVAFNTAHGDTLRESVEDFLIAYFEGPGP